MDLWTTALMSLLLVACAAALMLAHLRTWRRAIGDATTREELDYRRRQFRRRMQTSAMMAVLALALFVGEWLTGVVESRWFAVVYWLAVLAVVGWVVLLALADMLATKFHYDRVRHRHALEHAKMKAELRRLEQARDDAPSDNGTDRRH